MLREKPERAAGPSKCLNPFLCLSSPHTPQMPRGMKISRKIPPFLRSCRLTVLEPLTLVSGIIGTFSNLSSGMWVIKGYEVWAIIQQPCFSAKTADIKTPAHALLSASLPSATGFPFMGITSWNATLNWEGKKPFHALTHLSGFHTSLFISWGRRAMLCQPRCALLVLAGLALSYCHINILHLRGCVCLLLLF